MGDKISALAGAELLNKTNRAAVKPLLLSDAADRAIIAFIIR